MNNLKTCIRCGEQKAESDFYLDKSRGRRNAHCRKCHMKSTVSWAKQHEDRVKETRRACRQRNRERFRQREKAWVQAHPEQRQQIWQNYYTANRERMVARTAAYRQANVEKVRRSKAEARRRHPEKALAERMLRLARKKETPNPLTGPQWKAIVEGFGRACAYCLRSDVALTMDHLEPFRLGGQHTASNVVPACQSCNSRKQGTDLLSFLVGRQRIA